MTSLVPPKPPSSPATTPIPDTTLEEENAFSFGCYSRGALWTEHIIQASTPDQAIIIHEQKFPHHQFQSAARVRKPEDRRNWRKKA